MRELTIPCDADKTDELLVELHDDDVYIETRARCSEYGETGVSLNDPGKVERIRDALTEWLERNV